MITPRPRKTLADYLVIAICPLLIMALVGSISFFLLDLSYHGRWLGRLQWMLFWFVLASVLISRISIEQGPGYARTYGILLALATGALIYRLVGVAIAGWCLLAFIWWCTSKLTWDCTLVDDWEDASGEGLLQVGGLEKSVNESPPPADNGKGKRKKPPTWWDRLTKNSLERKDQPHSPGIWIVYFSLLALPAFGIGQLFFHPEDAVRREFGFKLLAVYVATALGLLLATSFLGLRRYLRQRSLQMPASIAGLWILLGTILASAVMAGCLLLPRPDATYSIANAVDKIAEAAKEASRHALLGGQSAEGDGKRIGTGEGETKDQAAKGGQAESQGQNNEQGKAGAASSQQQSADKSRGGEPNDKVGQKGEENKDGTDSKEHQKSERTMNPETPRDVSWIAELVRWLMYGLMIAAVLFVIYWQRKAVLATLREMLAALRAMLASLFSWNKKASPAGKESKPSEEVFKPRPFSSFTNPFAANTGRQKPPEEVVAYTFQALQAWAYERNCERLPDQTPMEFARQLSEKAPLMGEDARLVALLYTRIAYADFQPTPDHLSYAEQLWAHMQAAASPPPAVLRA